jgi:hypothetical protein
MQISKYDEMMGRLLVAGMHADNPPIGLIGGEGLRVLRGIRMKCTKATFLAQMQDGFLIEFEPKLPFGFLHVEAPQLPVNSIVAIRHKLDFQNAWELQRLGVFREPTREVHVRYKTQKGLKKLLWSFLPYLELTVFEAGIFEHFEPDEKLEPLLKLSGREQEPGW